MTEKLTWEEIKTRYDNEWVELVDFEWDMREPEPRSGVVRVHAKTRKEFYSLAKLNPPKNSAFVFVGDPFNKLGPNVFFNANANQWCNQK